MHDLISQFPHCDQRILHKPGTCAHCDGHPLWQQLRDAWGVAFTGEAPVGDQVPCPADHARPPDDESDHRRWVGNKPTLTGGKDWPPAVPSSQMMYGGIERLGARSRRGRRLPWNR